MKNYQDSNGAVHFLSDQDLLNIENGFPSPVGSDWVEITQAQAHAICNPPPTLAEAQTAQLQTLAAFFATASTAGVTTDVTDGESLIWSGGMSSAMRIYAAVQLALAAGADSVTLYDISNAPHVMTIAQGIAVAVAIDTAYQAVFAKYQNGKVAIAAATTVAEVQSITWS